MVRMIFLTTAPRDLCDVVFKDRLNSGTLRTGDPSPLLPATSVMWFRMTRLIRTYGTVAGRQNIPLQEHD
jgi:hypothetical protein